MNAAAGGRDINRFSRIKHDHDLRSLAMDVVVQLPKNEADALRVLEYARFLVADFRSGNVPASDSREDLRVVP